MIDGIKIKIDGMTCNHCVSNVEKKISKVEGVDSVDVNLNGHYAIVKGDNIDGGYIVEQVNSLGYSATL